MQQYISYLFLNFALVYAIRKAQVKQEGLKLNGIHDIPVYASDVNLLDMNIYQKEKHRSLITLLVRRSV